MPVGSKTSKVDSTALRVGFTKLVDVAETFNSLGSDFLTFVFISPRQ